VYSPNSNFTDFFSKLTEKISTEDTQQFKISGFRYRNIPVDSFYGSFEFRTETSGFLNLNFGLFEPKLRFCCSFCKEFIFVLPKLWMLIAGFFATETLEYRIHSKLVTKFWLSGNRNSRSFGS
jgi:hypothetical protein